MQSTFAFLVAASTEPGSQHPLSSIWGPRIGSIQSRVPDFIEFAVQHPWSCFSSWSFPTPIVRLYHVTNIRGAPPVDIYRDKPQADSSAEAQWFQYLYR